MVNSCVLGNNLDYQRSNYIPQILGSEQFFKKIFGGAGGLQSERDAAIREAVEKNGSFMVSI